MNTYEKMYYHLFNAVTDALDALAQSNYGQASELLKAAQQESEELFLAHGSKAKRASGG